MSRFLFYFEISNAQADWKAFRQAKPAIAESFDRANSHSLHKLSMCSCTLIYQAHPIEGAVILDGFSSDAIFTSPEKLHILSDFLALRCAFESVTPCLLLTLVEGDANFITVDGFTTEKLALSDLASLARERLYYIHRK